MSNEITHLIEQQAARIAELEAERDAWRTDADISKASLDMVKGRCGHLYDQLAALRAAIEQVEKAKPVAEVWRSRNKAAENGLSNTITEMLPMGTKLYTHPAPIPAGKLRKKND